MSTPTKRCTICGQEFPATTEYFARCRTNRDGLRYACKSCEARRERERKATASERRGQQEAQHLELAGQAAQAPLRRCKLCDQTFPATAEYFQPGKDYRDGLSPRCRKCCSRRQMELRKTFPERQANSQRMLEAGLRRCRVCHEHKPATLEHFCARTSDPSGLNSMCKTCQAKQNALAWRSGRYKRTPKANERSRRWRSRNRDKVRERMRQYQQQHPERIRAYVRRREARKRNLPNDFTEADWQFALEWWGGRCAYCGRPAGLLHTIAMDHFVPLTSPDCPGTVPRNIVPACHNDRGCNNQKSAKEPGEWILSTFGKDEGQRILARITAFFAAVRPANG